jgi:hypothetical protein
MGALISLVTLIAGTFMYLTAPELHNLRAIMWLIGVGFCLIGFGTWIIVRASASQVVLVRCGVVQMDACHRSRHVAWSRIKRVTYLSTVGALRLEAQRGCVVNVGVVLVGFGSFVRQVETRLDPSLTSDALNELRRNIGALG